MISFIKERFTVFPWVLLAAYIPFFTLEKIDVISMVFTLIALFFFRLFDDLECEQWDKSQAKQYLFHRNIEHLKKVEKVIFISLAIFMWIFFKPWTLFSLVFFIGFCRLLYSHSRDSYFINFISILKYPMIISILEFNFELRLSFWGSSLFLGMILIEYLEVTKKIKSKHALISQLSFLIAIAFIKLNNIL
jgi:hypothetical protein